MKFKVWEVEEQDTAETIEATDARSAAGDWLRNNADDDGYSTIILVEDETGEAQKFQVQYKVTHTYSANRIR